MRTFAILAAAAMLAGCESSRHGLPCVGLLNENEKVKDVPYEISIPNVVVGVIFSASIIVPAIVVLKDLECPLTPAPQK